MEEFKNAFIASIIGKSLTLPFEIIKNRITYQFAYLGISIQNWVELYQESFHRISTFEGVKGFWRGNLYNSFFLGIANGFTFAIYEKLKQKYNSENCSLAKNFLFGGFSGGTFFFISSPFQSIKKRKIVNISLMKDNETLKDIISKTFKEKGLAGFFEKSRYQLLGVISHRTIYFGVFDYLIGLDAQNPSNFLQKICFAFFSSTLALAFQLPFINISRYIFEKEHNKFKFERTPSPDKLWDFLVWGYKKEKLKFFFKTDHIILIKSISGSIILLVYQIFRERSANKKN